MKKLYVIIAIVLLITSCNVGIKDSDYVKLHEELLECREELADCKKVIDEFQNNPQVRLVIGEQYMENNDSENAKNEFNFLIENFNGTDEAKKAQSLITKIEKKEKEEKEAAEKRIKDLQAFEKYIEDCKSEHHTCIKVKENAVHVIYSAPIEQQTKWVYYEVGKPKITYRAKFIGVTRFTIANTHMMGYNLTDPKGNRLVGAIGVNTQTYKRSIILEKKGNIQVFDEVK